MWWMNGGSDCHTSTFASLFWYVCASTVWSESSAPMCWFVSSLLTGWRRKHLTMPLQNWIPWVRKAIRTLRLSCSCYVTTWHYGPQMCREMVREPWLYCSGLVFLLSLFAPFYFCLFYGQKSSKQVSSGLSSEFCGFYTAPKNYWITILIWAW